jgi:pimeloyl-ACP methyl ester carboxylesterase
MDLGTAPRLYAYTGGKPFDPARPTIVFIHGAQNDHTVWILQSRYLAHHGYGVLALDLPGHLRSEGPPLDSVEAMADRIARALDEAGVTRALVAGHSMGSLIALEVARRRADLVKGVALVGTAFPMRVAEPLLEATRAAPAEAMDMINVWSHSASIAAFDPKPSAPGPGFSTVWQNLRLMQRIARVSGPEVLAADFSACNRYAGGLEAAAALACPALFVLGAADLMTSPRAARALIDACRDKEVVTLPRTAHALMSENPDGVRTAIARFAGRVFGPAG